MPKLIDRQLVSQDTNSNTCVGVAPLTYGSIGDLAIWACYINARGGAPTAPTGWNEISFTDNDSDQFTLRVYRRTLQSGDTAPTLTHNFNCTNVNIMFFFESGTFDATTPIDGNADDIDTTEALKEIPSDTPSENNCGMLSLSAMDNNLAPIAEGNTTILELGHGTALSYYAGYTCLVDTTATEAVRVHCTGGDDSIQSTILIRDNSPTAPTHSPYAPHFNRNFQFVAIMTDERLTTATAESARDPTLNGLTTVNSKSITYDGGGVEFDDGLFPYLETWEMQIGAGSNYEGFELILGSTTDMSASGYQLGVHYVTGGPSSTFPAEAEGGFVMVLRSADTGGPTYNWKAYQMFSSEAVDLGAFRLCAMLEPGNAAAYELDSSGTLDLSAVTHVSFFFAQPASGSGYTIRLTELLEINPLTICGGSSGDEITFDNFYDQVTKVPALSIVKQGANQYLCRQPVRIGLNGHYAHFLDSNLSLEFAAQTDTANGIAGMNVSDNLLGIEINLEDSNGSPNISLTNSSVASVDAFHFRVKDYTTTQSNITTDFNNLIVSGPGETEWDDLNIAHSGITFVGRDEFNYTLSTMSGDFSGGCIFDGTPVRISSETHLQYLYNCTFQNNATAITITGNQAGTWSDPSLTVSGNTTDIEYTGSTNFTIESANALTVNNSGSGVLTISTPSTDITITASETGSLIRLYATGTQTVIASTTGTSLVYTYTGTSTYDWDVHNPGFLPQRGSVTGNGSDIGVTVTLVSDPVYDASHGLTYTTDASWSRTNNQLTVPTFGPSVRAIHSLLIDSFADDTITALRNTPYNIQMNGPNAMFLVDDAEGVSDATIKNMTAGGVRYVNTSGTTTAEWIGIESIGTAAGFQGEYQQVAGSGTTDARATGSFDEIIKVYGDAGHGNFDYRGHLVLKYQPNGYQQVRVDVLNTYGVSTLEPGHYIVAMEPQAIAAATGDPAITVTLVDHTASPLVVGGKSFDYEIQDGGTNSAEDILREWDYNLSLDAAYQSTDPFNLPDFIVEEGSNYATARGIVETKGTTLRGCYVSRASADHPEFARFQSNDGTYYTPATVAQVSAPNVTDGRIQIYNNTAAGLSAWQASTAYTEGQRVLRTTGLGNELGDGVFFVCTTAGTSSGSEPTWDVSADGNTTADGTVTWTVRPVEFDNAVTTSGYSSSWTDGEHFTSGDVIRMRWVDEDDLEILATGVATVDGTTTFLNSPSDDTVYDSYGITGSTVTEYAADYPNVQVDVTDPDNVFYLDRFYAWHKYNLTTADGIRNFFGAVTATDTSNITINNSVVDIFFDNTKSVSARQGDTIVIQRADGAYPQVTVTSGGGGLGFYYSGIGYSTSSGSGLDTTERNKLLGLYNFDPTTNTAEGSETYQQMFRLMRAALLGKVSISGNDVTFRDAADTKDRITSTTDSNGQRTAVTTDGT